MGGVIVDGWVGCEVRSFWGWEERAAGLGGGEGLSLSWKEDLALFMSFFILGCDRMRVGWWWRREGDGLRTRESDLG